MQGLVLPGKTVLVFSDVCKVHEMFLTQGNSSRHSSAVDPEGHPGQHDHQGGGEIGLEQEEEDVAAQGEVDVQTVVPAWAGGGRNQ